MTYEWVALEIVIFLRTRISFRGNAAKRDSCQLNKKTLKRCT